MRYQTRIANYRHKIVFQTKTIVSDGMGTGGDFTWTDTKTIFAAIWPVSSKMMIENAVLNHELSHRIRIRHTQGLSPHMRIIKGLRIFNIISMRTINEENLEIEILANEVTI